MADQPQQRVQIRVDETKMQTSYANTIRTATTQDEFVMDFGLNIPQQQGQGQDPTMVFGVSSRVVMNWAGAKRLLMSLNQAISAYEERFGTIEIPGAQPPAQG